MQEIQPGVLHWTSFHEGIGAVVHSHALVGQRPVVLIDPRLPEGGVEAFAAYPPAHIVLTNRHHFRHSGALRKRYGAQVWCHHAGLHELAPDQQVRGFNHGDELPGGVFAVEIASLCPDETALLVPRSRLLCLGDALVRDDDSLQLVADAYMGDDPAAVQRGLLSAFGRCLDLDFDTLLLAHGEPFVENGKRELRRFVAARGQRYAL